MKIRYTFLASRVMAVVLSAAVLSGCNLLTRLSEVGEEPTMTDIINPMSRPDYRPVNLPMPAPLIAEDNPNSLWRAGARAFFKDHRAKAVGDIITVKLDLEDSASLENKTDRDRTDREDADVTMLAGYQAKLFKNHLGGYFNPADVANFGNRHQTEGDGSIDRSEEIELTFAAVVTQILPNGALVLVGRQEIRVNSELRELMVTGVVRPEDIESDNTITHDKIAEMRVAYGGRGTLSGLQQPRWGTQIWDIVFPF
jgi:flagellar L-ring protein FlgH